MNKLTTGIAIAGLLAPLATHALGVGEIRLQSYLNQTLRAEIPLVLSRESVDDLRIQLASPRDFAAAGLDRPSILTKLRFIPERKTDGGFIIRVASTEAIREPYLNFLVELAWPEGRILKTFTVLLDPPNVLAAPRYPEPMQAAVIDGNLDQPPARAPAAYPPRAAEGGDYGPVGRNEKLWTIAQRLNPDPASITTEQVVIALFRYNPDAFSRPSVNALNAGATLRVPPLPFIQELSPAAAREEFFRQQRGRPARWLSEPPRHEVAAERIPDNPVASYRPPVTMPQAAAPAVLGDASLKAVETLQRENAEMRKRLVELEKRVADLQVLFAERELLAANGQPQAQLNSGPAKETIAERAPTAATTPTTQTVGDVHPEPAPSGLPPTAPTPASAAAPETAATENAVPAVAPQTAAAPAVAVKANVGTSVQTAQPDGQGALIKWMLVAASAAVGTLIGLLAWQRRRTRDTASHAPDLNREPSVGAAVEAFSGRIDTARTEPEEVDPAFEADIYVSYGRYDQALETIETALRRHPGRDAYELKLLDLLSSQGNVARFHQELDRLRSAPKPKETDFWDKVRALQERLPAMPGSAGAEPVGVPAAAPDETDRLIDEIKRFSLSVSGEAGAGPGSPGDPKPDAPQTVRSTPTEPDHHDIPWVPVPKTTKVAQSGTPALTEPPSSPGAAPVDGEHLIEFEGTPGSDTKPAEAETLDQEFDELASESIDSLLKELSALHYERHLQADLPDTGETALAPSGPADATAGETASPGDGDPRATTGPASSPTDSHLPALDLETKLDLARAYSDMGDYEQARQFLQEVISDGSTAQRVEAEALLASFAHH